MTTSVNSTMVMPEESDLTRTLRLFTGLSNTIVGADQNMNGEDPFASNRTGQYTIANPDGTYSVMGMPRSNLQTPMAASAAGASLMPLLLIAGVVYFLVRHQ